MTPWSKFFTDKISKILTEKKSVIDIGGGLRATPGRGNRHNPAHKWMVPLIDKIDYMILDPVDTYKPDIIGDIHNLPFGDNTQDAILCLAVLEHVENPIQAYKEIYRTLKLGGYALIYVPFLYYYHAEKGYYGDFWRFTEDGLRWLSKPFSQVEIQSVRGAIGTWIRLSFLGRYKFTEHLANLADRLTGRLLSKQTSGYYVFLIK